MSQPCLMPLVGTRLARFKSFSGVTGPPISMAVSILEGRAADHETLIVMGFWICVVSVLRFLSLNRSPVVLQPAW